MAESKPIKQVHAELMLFLNDNIPRGGDIYQKLLTASKQYLTPLDITQVNTAADIVDKLINKGECSFGDYGILGQLVNKATQNRTILQKIDAAQQPIKDMGTTSAGCTVGKDQVAPGRAPMSDDDLADEKLSNRIAKQMGGEGQSILRDLGVPHKTIDQIWDESIKVANRNFKGLEEWRRLEQQNATRRRLRTVLETYIGFQELEELFK